MSAPRILLVGGNKGSFEMRGKQMGAALGATVTSKPKPEHWANADVVILVKHAAFTWGNEARDCGKRLIWDVLDFWEQPAANARAMTDMVREVEETRNALEIRTLICATDAMGRDLGGHYIPHHAHAGLTPTPPRDVATVVAYEGSERYLGSWRAALERVCDRLGLRFVINPPSLADADIVVAFRGEQWDGWACRRWKSGVKYVNAIAAGRPVLTQGSASFFELRAPGQVVERQEELTDAIRAWLPVEARLKAFKECGTLAPALTLEAVEGQYRQLLRTVVRRAA